MSLENPIKAVKGGRIDIAPRLQKSTMGALNREYLAERNAGLALKRRSAEIDLAIREGALLPASQLKVQVSFLISAAREAVRAWHVRLPPLLVGKNEHEIGIALRGAEAELLNILAELPAALGNGVNIEDVEKATPPAPSPPPEESVRSAARAERERAKRDRWNATRRERRAAAKRGEGE
jgi:hypothetical protein